MKRTIDVVVGFILIILCLPIMVFAAILIKSKIGSPIFFKQERIGFREKKFTIYKFRTMTNAKDKAGSYLPDNERMTKFGTFLRKLSIDEMPQLWNVLKGDMSFVGPRPLLIKYLPYYTENERKRHSVRPGITGLAQVSGRNNLNWDKRFQLDVQYVMEKSIWLDLQIIGKTCLKVLKSEGVSEIPSETMLDLDIERQLVKTAENK
ncbi:sugar transferase [Metabacillus idriensis]|uniref:Bacterial sugar transferase domain-containing protein n=1 Tax=Metabacillus idriensis TaxID=324768 RepID=A0A6I2MA05_9BACI|nr:sugar transferase [Metabacillus idriensis]MCM3598328.1 sugar transferase [Metabacillus idriensis]MRX55050.1 hypothetical protein [Metabacillus idriensis]OHR71602.1 hypothetical protein HMPREF3291_23935 [Bacillus sp. HMSC76G11]